jgi:nucleotide-binding universal stress UspA family protein
MKISRILHATDFSGGAEAACELALTLARLAGAELHVLHVVNELVDWRRSRVPAQMYELLEKEVEVQAVRDLAAFCESRLARDVKYTSEVLVGVPFEKILERARGIGADLIVIGTRGRSPLEQVVVGSTAERVVRRSEIPVLTVRGRD